MADELGIQKNATDYQGKPVVFYSTKPDGQTEAAFDTAIADYNSSRGSISKGFAVLPPGSAHQLRSGYEAARAVVEPIAHTAGTVVGGAAAAVPTGIAALLSKAGIVSPAVPQTIAKFGREAGEGVADFATSLVNTPEKLLATAAQAAVIPLTGGLPILAAAGIQGAATTGGYLLGGSLTGSPTDMKQAITEGTIAGFTGGALGIVKTALGKGVAGRAQQKFSKDMTEYIKGKYGGITNDPAALEALVSTEKGLQDTVITGVKSLMGDFQQTGGRLLDNVRSATARTMPAGPARSVSMNISKFGDASVELVENIGDAAKMQAAKLKMESAANNILLTIGEQYRRIGTGSKIPADVKIAEIDGILRGYGQQMGKFVPGMQMLKSLEKSRVDGKFNIDAFQKTMLELSQSTNEVLYREAGRVAEGSMSVPFNPLSRMLQAAAGSAGVSPWMQKGMGAAARATSFGQRYPHVTAVTAPVSEVAGHVGSREALRSFFTED